MCKQTVLIIGATGEAGSNILNGLLESGNFNIVAGVRPPSASKPQVNALKSRGVEIRVLDLENSNIDQLTESLKGVDIVISAIYPFYIHLQESLADASKKAGIKRLIPCDWGPACVRGIRKTFDDKLSIQDYIKEIGIVYTFIDVGWWTQVLLPYPDPSKAYTTSILDHSKYRFGTGDVKCAVTDVRDIGKFVARIIVDDRTLNRYVFCWTEEVTQNEALALAERISGLKFDLPHLSVEEIMRKLGDSGDFFETLHSEYWHSLWVRGDNTVENAKKSEYGGALDARELYPELGKELRTLKDYARDLYLS